MKAEILDLHPTQIAVGYQQVAEKEQKLRHMKGGEVKEYLKKKAVPVVKGPRDKYYLIDHHHLCKAAYNLELEEVYIDVVADVSHMTDKEFWEFMNSHHYIWPYDETGKHLELAEFCKALPKNVRHLRDDPYRSLAGILRRKGAFQKDMTPFSEFKWANYLRTRILNLKHIDNDVIEVAMALL
jgi:hypothetical protein